MRCEETVITCDRCGANIKEDVRRLEFTVWKLKKEWNGKIDEVDFTPIARDISDELPGYLVYTYWFQKNRKSLDLCPNCRRAFAEFMRGEGNGNNRG